MNLWRADDKSTFSGYVEKVLQPHYRRVREAAKVVEVAKVRMGGGGAGADELRS